MKRIGICIFMALMFVTAGAQETVADSRLALRRLIARADSGDAKALYDLGHLHDIGYDSIPVDSVRSTSLYRLSAEKGYPPAMNFLGFRYYRGETVDKDIDTALYWIRLAASGGDITAAANLGYMLADSPEIPHDYEEAINWLALAAEAGMEAAQYRLIDLAENIDTPKAHALLGEAYSKGWVRRYDHKTALRQYYQAAAGGNAPAQFILAETLEFFPDSLLEFDPLDLPPSLFIEGTGAIPLEQLNSPHFWYEKAAQAGITDSETAFRQLYSIPSGPAPFPSSEAPAP